MAPPVFKTGLAANDVAGGFDSLPPPPSRYIDLTIGRLAIISPLPSGLAKSTGSRLTFRSPNLAIVSEQCVDPARLAIRSKTEGPHSGAFLFHYQPLLAG